MEIACVLASPELNGKSQLRSCEREKRHTYIRTNYGNSLHITMATDQAMERHIAGPLSTHISKTISHTSTHSRVPLIDH